MPMELIRRRADVNFADNDGTVPTHMSRNTKLFIVLDIVKYM